MRVKPSEFQKLDLRCHTLLADARLHDVWTISLKGGGPNRTMSDVLAVSPFPRSPSNSLVRDLFAVRRALGRLFGWDEERHDTAAESYVHRLSDEDWSRSLISPGTQRGPFRMIYLFPNEAVGELRNATAHAFVATALSARTGGYVLYWAIYVKPVSRLTPIYMAVIDPFRRFVVYPALIRELQAAWSRTYA
jgi:hypothetical protein